MGVYDTGAQMTTVPLLRRAQPAATENFERLLFGRLAPRISWKGPILKLTHPEVSEFAKIRGPNIDPKIGGLLL